MDWLLLALAAVLLPVFPFSLLFNRLISSAPGYWMQAAAVVLLPQLGIRLMDLLPQSRLPFLHGSSWIGLVIFTAMFYAFRAISVRDVAVWARLMATSGLTLAWLLRMPQTAPSAMPSLALAWSAPAALLTILAGRLAARAGGAYLGLQGGLATVLPRLSALMALSALAVGATPVFPSFFTLIHVFLVLHLSWLWPLLLLILIWGWSVGSFLQELLFGTYRGERIPDLGAATTWLAASAVVFLALSGPLWSGIWIGI